LGTQPVAFGVISVVLGVDAVSSTAALLLNAVSGLLQAAMRLLPVSHRDVQALLHALRPEIAAIVARVGDEAIGPLRAFQPLQEIASMRHAGATARQFAS
jgi:urease accessory protein UreF